MNPQSGQLRLDDQVAIVTGAARGLGRSHAWLLGKRGAKVVINDIKGAKRAAAEFQADGITAVANAADVSTPTGATELIQTAQNAFGRIDILVNNAGVGKFTPMTDVTLDEYEEVRRVGLDASFYVTRAAWPVMVKQRYGRVIITTSGNGLIGDTSTISYAAAKAGAYGLMRALAIEGKPLGILVNGLNPMASTPMSRAFVSPEVAEMMDHEYPTELVSPAVVVLASRECPTSGTVVDAGGGRVGSIFVEVGIGYYNRDLTPESILASWAEVINRKDAYRPETGITAMASVLAVAKNHNR
jgi:NAD(P)-dependent dehydrogenase (short-subunit alcohol dehydrogenase family)